MYHFVTEQIEQSTNVADLKQLIGDNIDLVIECGFTKPITKIQLCDKAEIVQMVTLHKVVLASLAELSQFCDGLASLGVREAVKKHSDLFTSFFSIENECALTPGTCIYYLLYL